MNLANYTHTFLYAYDFWIPIAPLFVYIYIVMQKIGVNAEGYSVMNSGQVRRIYLDSIIILYLLQSTQRLPGYGQLGNVVSACVHSL